MRSCFFGRLSASTEAAAKSGVPRTRSSLAFWSPVRPGSTGTAERAASFCCVVRLLYHALNALLRLPLKSRRGCSKRRQSTGNDGGTRQAVAVFERRTVEYWG